MAGCDYLKNLKGIGFKTIMSIYLNKNQKDSLKSFLSKRNLGNKKVDEYINDVEAAVLGFKHPIIFDKNRNLSYLTPIDQKMSEEKMKMVNYYSGTKFENAEMFVEGKLDIKTMEVREKVAVDFQRITDFLRFVPEYTSGRLNNLCTRLVTFDNFDEIETASKEEDKKSELETVICTKRIKRAFVVK